MFGAKILGLEQSILEKCESTEVTLYNRVAGFFVFLICIAFISFYYFFYLLTSSYIIPVFLSLFTGFICFSVVRFTLISINVPLYEDEISLKKLFFNLGNSIRILIFSAFVLIITIPFVAIFHHSDFSPKVNLLKTDLLMKCERTSERLVNQKLIRFENEINALKNDRILLEKKKSEAETVMDKKLLDFKISQVSAIISTKENQINLKKQQNKIEVKQILKKYSKSLEVSDFPFYRFSLIFKNPDSLFFFYVFFIGFNLIIPFYIGVLVRKNNKYATLYREETKLIIQNNYKITEKECSDYLLKEHKYVVKKIEIYTDEPFNRKKKEWIYKKIENVELMNHFDTPAETNV